MYKTPCYKIDFKILDNNCISLEEAFKTEWPGDVICGYSVKTNDDTEIIRHVYQELGWYVEIVSSYEYKKCIEMGVSPARMIYNGPNKNLLESEAAYINLDSLNEVRKFCDLRGKYSNANVGIRLNFDLESKCPGETTASNAVSRFGIDCDNGDIEKVVKMLKGAGIARIGLHMHYSTKTRSIRVFAELARQAVNTIAKYGLLVSFIDMGGGFWGGRFAPEKPTPIEYAKCVCDILKEVIDPQKTPLIIEPGASILATSSKYIVSVKDVKCIRGTNIVTTDGTLLHINPFMVKRNQPFILHNKERRAVIAHQIVCGATCMEMDRLAELIDDKELKVGDILEFEYVGAYSMSFNSNFILEPPMRHYIK